MSHAGLIKRLRTPPDDMMIDTSVAHLPAVRPLIDADVMPARAIVASSTPRALVAALRRPLLFTYESLAAYDAFDVFRSLSKTAQDAYAVNSFHIAPRAILAMSTYCSDIVTDLTYFHPSLADFGAPLASSCTAARSTRTS
ncbi:hypothetical protein [Actinokineospora iranica]|uniref:Uncharacterized protein n=1 Tax=Actinokineospora iranica TaxID=1271860 RepID=A0A1G6XTP8_9PSEU|nr:hypothetical protein [Actinokineospora iranica]SDD80757.1 hypothetical protein SAMN05216174_11890 [Actinokineospora iranica]